MPYSTRFFSPTEELKPILAQENLDGTLFLLSRVAMRNLAFEQTLDKIENADGSVSMKVEYPDGDHIVYHKVDGGYCIDSGILGGCAFDSKRVQRCIAVLEKE